MCKVYFSASRRGFFLDDYIKDGTYGSNLPNDLILMTSDENNIYRLGNPEFGYMLGDDGGRPAWVNIPMGTMNDIFESERKGRMSNVNDEITILQDAIDLGMSTDEEKTRLLTLKKYRVLLARVDISNAPNVAWPEYPL